MKENKGNEVMDEGVKSQSRPPTGEKRKNISSRVDLGLQYKSSKPQDVKSPHAFNQESLVQILTLNSKPKDPPSKKISSIVHAPTSSTSSKEVPQHLLGNKDLAWERISTAVTDVDVGACYNMSLKDFEHSGIHDLFKVSFFFIFYFLFLYILSLTNDVDMYLIKF